MKVERVWLTTDAAGQLVDVPPLPPSSQIEAILLMTDAASHPGCRTPPPELASITTICGDLVEPVADEEDWDSLR